MNVLYIGVDNPMSISVPGVPNEKVRPSVLEKIFNFDWHIVRDEPPLEFYDTHPRPKEHLKYLDAVLPEISISENTRAWVNDYRYWENKTFPNYPKIRL